ncbi:MAG TPA: phosphoenolpyruvate mutase, partial [Gammaproteobacteria bacterium]|nr:phosphoenolpyruvate mutase [Gammaproteobacteria bacterium]
FHDDMIVMYGDLLFRSYILHDLLEQDSEIVVVVDSGLNNPHTGHTQDLAYCTEADDRSIFQPPVLLQCVRDQPLAGGGNPSGRWIGMVRFRNLGRVWLDAALAELRQREDFASLGMPELLNHLIERGHPVRVHYVHGHWLDVNALADIGRAHDFTRGISQ